MVLCAANGCNKRTDRNLSDKRTFYSISNPNIHPDRAPLKEILGGQCNYRDMGYNGTCCGRALKAAGGVENDSVVRTYAPKK